MLELKDLLEIGRKKRYAEVEKTANQIEEARARIVEGILLRDDLTEELDDYSRAVIDNDKAYKEYRNTKWEDDLRKDYTLFMNMAYQLKSEFDAVVDYDKIIYKGIGKSIQFNVKMLAAMFDLHCGVFNFGSGFTTHEAYTPTEKMIHIGIDPNNNDNILIDFHFDKEDK